MTRKIALAIFLLSLLSCPAGATSPCDSASGCWVFTEGSGTTVADSSPNSNTGNFKGSGEPAWSSISGTNAPSYADYMVDFDGSDDYISIASDASILPQYAMTITMWVNFDALASSGQNVKFYTRDYQDSSSGRDFELLWENWSDIHSWAFNSWASDGTIKQISYAETPTLGTWYFIVAIRNQSEVRLYRNGTSIADSSVTAWNLQQLDRPIYFGASDFGGSLSQFTNCKITESSFFSDTLDSTDINDIMDNGLVQGAPPAGGGGAGKYIRKPILDGIMRGVYD